MDEKEILEKIKQYFDIEELAGPRTCKRYGNRAFRFFDFRLLETIIILREALGVSIFANNWNYDGRVGIIFSQRGLRTNIQPLVKDKTERNKLYISPHILGKGLDFDVQGFTAHEVRVWIQQHEDIFPYKIRLEAGVNWTHLDIVWEEKNPKVYIFNP